MNENNNSTVNSYALHDILLGIATSLTEAEQQLRNQPPYDAFGRPNTIYQVPYLDFNLQVTTEFETLEESTTTGDAGTTSGGTEYKARVLWAPAPRQTTRTDINRTEIYSSISGRFVANVPNEGMPQVVIGTTVSDVTTSGSTHTFTIKATVSNAANELLPNTKVEFNFDEARTTNLNEGTALQAPPTFSLGEVYTNENAEALITVTLPDVDFSKDDEFFYVFIVNVGPVIKLISISNK